MTLLERDANLDELDQLLQQAASGAGRLALVGGEAGIGKTSLIDAFSRNIATSALVLRGACDPLSTPQALGPVRDIAALVNGDLPHLFQDGTSRDEIFRAVLSLLSQRRRLVVMIIEDVHWADEATMDLLRFIGRRIGDQSGLAIATYRDDEVGHRHPLRVVLGDLATSRAVRRIHVPPLTIDAVRTLASESHIDPVDLHRHTGGNPYFVSEVLAAGSDRVPSSIQDIVLARSGRLSASGRAALEVAAVIGATIEPSVLRAAAGTAAIAIEESVSVGLILTENGGYTFRHEIAREAVLNTIAPQRLLTVHHNVLTALRSFPPETVSPARLAHHAEGAADSQAVLEYAPMAARRAAQLRSHREAAAQYARALRFGAHLSPADRADILEQRSYECYLTDQLDEALIDEQSALDIWKREVNLLKEGENLRWLSRLSWFLGQNSDARTYGHDALSVLEQLPPGPQLAMAHSNMSQLQFLAADYDSAIRWGERAIVLGEELGEIEVVIHALNNKGTARLHQGDERGRGELSRSLTMAKAEGLEEHVARALTNLGSVAAAQYQFALADQYLVEGIAYCTDHDLDSWRLYKLSWYAVSLLYQGAWSKAGEIAAMVLADSSVSPVSRIQALVVLGCLRARRGDPEVGNVLDEALALADTIGELQRLGPVRAARAEAAWLAGNSATAAGEALTGYALADSRQDDWLAGRLAFWVWRTSGIDEVPSYLAEPYRLQIIGDWQAAARRWQELGCPYEEAQALAESDDPDVLRRALRIFEEWGPLRWQPKSRKNFAALARAASLVVHAARHKPIPRG